MNKYDHQSIEKKWQKYWLDHNINKINTRDDSKPKYYVLDMFPYPSGAGLHVGHPLGYIASDIYARFKRLTGYNVLHPMGFDSFGLPAEQYAILTGQHPRITTDNNIERYKSQLNMIGLSYDWENSVMTSDPNYYKWTQWIFIQIFESWYDNNANKARPISDLIDILQKEGNKNIDASCDQDTALVSAEEWNSMTDIQQSEFLLKYRLAYLSDSTVNWCPDLGTVLANEEVKDGVSERGGYPVFQKKMKQWSMRVTAYAERLLSGLDEIDWSTSMKETQKNWIGKSYGAELSFPIINTQNQEIDSVKVYTTRPDTIFGMTFLVIAPEHPLLDKLDLNNQAREYIEKAKRKSQNDRSKEKESSGCFTGYHTIHPFTKKSLPIWVADYVLYDYGTGAVLAVPAHDERDYLFAKKYELPIIKVVEGKSIDETSNMEKDGKLINSDFLNGLEVKDAIESCIDKIESLKIGIRKTNYKIRDAVFSRQRYWGEPIPIYYKDGIPYSLTLDELPLELPEVDDYLPTKTGEPPLARAKNWKTKEGYDLELNTMPGWAGSSWYFFRYMDSKNENQFASIEDIKKWNQVDLYVGGSEHATGHLIYSRFWAKFLYDRGYTNINEPFKKLINQGMIQGVSSFVYRIKGQNKFVSYNLRNSYKVTKLHVDISFVKNNILDIDKFRNWREEYRNADFELEGDKYICGSEVEKMSKSKYNTVNPDDIIEKYGADSFRLYSMFLGPLVTSKPWSTNGIDGTYRFMTKLWSLFYDREGSSIIDDEQANEKEFRIINQAIKKIYDSIERYSFNTCVSTFMICVNELKDINCHKKEILEMLVLLIAPFCPHISEELWQILGGKNSVFYEKFPSYDSKYIAKESYDYPIAINGKTKLKLSIPLGISNQEIEKYTRASEEIQNKLENKSIKKLIIVPGRIINIII